MADKKKQSAVVVVATVMSITSVLSPVATVYAADAETTVVQQAESTEIRENAPPVTLPQEPSGNDGQALQDITLPDGWSWTDGNTIISREKPEYPARIAVDDKTYDYSAVEGYNEEEHFVEKNIPVTVLVPETEENTALFAMEQVQVPQTDSISSNTDKVEINPTDFPDEKFREYLLDKFDDDSDSKIAIADVTNIDVFDRTDITDLKGIEKFTDLIYLYCGNTGIQALDVSENTALRELYCYDTEIQNLDVSNNSNLEKLECSNTEIQALDVSENTALRELYYSSTEIQALDVSKNTKLERLFCYRTGIESLNVSKNTALISLYCSDTGIQDLDVDNNSNLESLDCSNTEIQTLDVSNNSNLESLDCSNTEIQALDVSDNTKLEILYCYSTGITTLDVSKNTALRELYCFGTGIQALDVSNSHGLKYLNTESTNLAYLDWGMADLSTWDKTSSTVDLTVTGDTFDITKKFAGIDISKLSVISGGRLDGNNITNYKVGTPIQYAYACGSVNGSPDTLIVTLNLSKSDNKIEITSNPDMTYTGNPVENPSVDPKGSTGDVTYTYEIWNGRTWDKYTGIPTNVAKYRVTAHLAEDDFNNAAEATKEFTISQAANGWTEDLAMAGWTYGEKAVSPTAKAKFGDVIFTYSDSEKGTYTDTVPTDAGIWYVKAAVTSTDNYAGVETTRAFTIVPKNIDNNSQIVIPDIKSDKDVENLVIKDGDKELKKGTDYDVSKKQDGSKVTVTITFKGNYTGTVTKTYTVENKKPSGNTDTKKPSSSTKNDKNGAVQTGDTTTTGLWAMLMVLSAGTATLLKSRKRKEKTVE